MRQLSRLSPERTRQRLLEHTPLDSMAAGNLAGYLSEQQILWVGRGVLGPRDGPVALYPRSGVSQLLEPPPEGALEDPVERCIFEYPSRRGASVYLELQQAVYRLEPDLPKADLEEDPALEDGLRQLARVRRRGALRILRVDGAPAVESPLAPRLIVAGFVADYRSLILERSFA